MLKQHDIEFPETPENNQTNKPLIEHTPLEGTPFTITGNTEQGYFLRLRDYRLTQFYWTQQEVKEQLELKKWDLITNLIITIIDANEKNNNQ